MKTHAIRTSDDWRATPGRGAADWLCLAAAPAFAIMAVVTVLFRSQDIVCSAVHGASPLNGMVWMYVLMSGFHSAPWLKLLSAWRRVTADHMGKDE
jgi:hypothetical protein